MGLGLLKYALFHIISFFYVMLVVFVYFSKKKIMTIENYIFSFLLINVSILLVADMSSIILPGMINNLTFIKILNHFCILLVSIWLITFTLYIFVISSRKNQGYVSFKENKEKEYFKNVCLIFGFLLTIVGVLCFTLPVTFPPDTYIVAMGPAVYLVYGCYAFATITIIVCSIKGFRIIPKEKYIPVIAFLVLITFIAVIQIFNPTILLSSSCAAYVTILLFFTIENPDVNLIEKLNNAKSAADKANSTKTEFLSNMSHEIRTPLNAIVGFSQALKDENISDEARDEVDDIIMSSNNLLEIVNGILDISKIESNKLEIVNAEYDSQRMFKEIVSLAKARLASRPIDLKVNLDQSLPPVLYGDYLRVKQIIVNLVTNATKYTREGFISLTLKCTRDGSKVNLHVEVADSGIGIKKEDIDKLFTKFQRFDLVKNSTTEGTGLGLAITKSLVELMNGTIRAESEYGKGTTFIVDIVQGVVEKEVNQIESAIEENVKPFKTYNKRVLVVDDNNVNLKVAKRLLQDYNIEPETVTSAQECLNKIKSGIEYDLIFMDDMMPKMTGTECFNILKNMPDFKIPVVALTANAITGMKEKYLSIGFDDYLAKPIVKNQLYRIIKKFLGNSIDFSEMETSKMDVTKEEPKVETPKVEEKPVEEKKEEVKETPKKKEVELDLPKEVDLPILSTNDDESDKTTALTLDQVKDLESSLEKKKETPKEEPVEEVKEEPKEEPAEEESAPTGEKKDQAFLESKGVDVNHGLELLGDMETYDMCLEEFVNGFKERTKKLEDYKNNNNMPDYAIEVHAMKSDSKYLGFMTLADLAYEHEMASKDNNLDLVTEKYDALMDEANKIYKIAKEYLGQ